VDPSPDGRYLLVSWLEGPWSTALPAGRFPRRTQLWRRDGTLVRRSRLGDVSTRSFPAPAPTCAPRVAAVQVREIAALPLADAIPIAMNSVRTGPRAVSWRPDAPAQLYWIEAQARGGAVDVDVWWDGVVWG
jgi:hypothetical protein